MRKNLFLTCAFALASFAGVQAQTWSHTLVQGLPGTEVTTDINGTKVTQYRVETQLFNHAATNAIRYTVLETTQATGVYGGGPFFAMGEIIVLNANGDTIPYTATSNADHNSGGAGTDGAGLPALNDGNLNNFFHSSWGGTEPGGYHYIEMALSETVDAFKVIWYTRPNQHVNRPTLVGLTPGGEEFVEPYGEYQYSLGDKVNNIADLADENSFFTFYVEGPTSFMNGDEEVTGRGNVYVSIGNNSHDVGEYYDPTPKNIMQLIKGNGDNNFVVYQPLLDTYFADASAWSGNYNGANGWQYAYSVPQFLQELEFTQRADGDFELSYEIEHEGEPLKVWIGYDMRGSLKIFPEAEKNRLEAAAGSGDYSGGSFGLPVDFGFTIFKANVAEGLIAPISVKEISEKVITPTIEDARERIETYGNQEGYDTGELADLEEAIAAAEAAIEDNDIAGIFTAQDELKKAVSAYMAARVYYYQDIINNYLDNSDFATPPYSQADTGRYPESAMAILEEALVAITNVESNFETLSPSQIDQLYATAEALIEQFENSTIAFSEFPTMIGGISDAKSSTYPNNAVWRSNDILLDNAVNGIRLTVLANYQGSAASNGFYGDYPMLALGELKLYDQNGDEIELTEENVYASHVEQNEGFESTAARLVDGVWGQGDGVTADGQKAAGSYFHSPWGGTAPDEYVYIEVEFPEAMSAFSVELYSRDASTTGGRVSLWPKELVITKHGEKYDPLLFAENPYNVFVGEQVTDVAQITADGLYVIKGLLNTSAKYGLDEETGEATGVAKFYSATSRFHESASAVRANCVYRIVPNGDGTFTILSIHDAKYWPSSDAEGFVSSVVSKEKAAKLKIVPANTEFESSFVMYEEHAGLVTEGDSIDTDEDGVFDAVASTTATPYVVYMDWYSGLATRAVANALPRAGVAEDAPDAWGDSLCFNKGNGEGEWQIYKVDMNNPDFYWLTNMVGIVDGLGLEVGTDPGCVASLGDLQSAYDAAQVCIADSAYAEAPAVAKALSEKIALAESLEKNPMKPGVYMITSAFGEYFKQQNTTKSIYVTLDEYGAANGLRWGNTEANNVAFYFDFQLSSDASMYVEAGNITEEEAAQCYTIRAIGTTEAETPYYIGEIEGLSTQIDPVAEWASSYVVLPATGSAFNLAFVGNLEHCLHSNQHGNGAGNSGNLVYWYGDPGASQWRLQAVDYTTAIEDLVVEGDEVVSVAYYTVAGAASSTPSKGINIVRIVYANGVVETKKLFVK